MRTPKWTDAHRYPNGYVRAQHTDIKRTFRRARDAIKVAEEERKRVLVQIKRKETK